MHLMLFWDEKYTTDTCTSINWLMCTFNVLFNLYLRNLQCHSTPKLFSRIFTLDNRVQSPACAALLTSPDGWMLSFQITCHSSVWHWQVLPSLALLTRPADGAKRQQVEEMQHVKYLSGCMYGARSKGLKNIIIPSLSCRGMLSKSNESSAAMWKVGTWRFFIFTISQRQWGIHAPWAIEHIYTNVKRQICCALLARLCKKKNADTICHPCATLLR